ncbi:ABZJ_00895 family protein [Gordonia araii]|nr:ABZJ_00895 family protein [Gordonia araii]NNG99109.1 hypothetical protein [Gordonia araii NBRC 100433]
MTDRQIDRDELADAPVWPYILWLFAALIGFGVLWVFFGEAMGDGAVGIAGIVATPTLAAGVAADRFVADRFRVPNPGERRRLIWWSFAVLGVPFLLDWAYRFVVLVAADKEVPMPVYEGNLLRGRLHRRLARVHLSPRDPSAPQSRAVGTGVVGLNGGTRAASCTRRWHRGARSDPPPRPDRGFRPTR